MAVAIATEKTNDLSLSIVIVVHSISVVAILPGLFIHLCGRMFPPLQCSLPVGEALTVDVVLVAVASLVVVCVLAVLVVSCLSGSTCGGGVHIWRRPRDRC